ncbi:MAG: class I SAM-dependent methyltransferase [Thermomicrobiales bacterium]
MTDGDPRAPFSGLFVGGDRTDTSLAWFEQVYDAAAGRDVRVPWDRGAPHRHLVEWSERAQIGGDGKRAIVVGCGTGDDAEFVVARGFEVIAFDIAPTAIRMAQERFPESRVQYRVADLFSPPDEWLGGFDLVVENQTLQALPADIRPAAVTAVARLLAPGGMLLVLANRAVPGQPVAGPPWPLTREEMDGFTQVGLTVASIEALSSNGHPRWRAVYRHS